MLAYLYSPLAIYLVADTILKTTIEQITLPAALLSRFDLLWLIQDRPTVRMIMAPGSTLLTFIRTATEPPLLKYKATWYEINDWRYIALCKNKNPIIPRDFNGAHRIRLYWNAKRNPEIIRMYNLYFGQNIAEAILRLSTALVMNPFNYLLFLFIINCFFHNRLDFSLSDVSSKKRCGWEPWG